MNHINRIVALKALIVVSFLFSLLLPIGANAVGQTYTGNEDSVIDITPIKAPSIIKFSYSGERVFSVTPVDSTGKEGFPIVLKIGEFQGSYFQGAPTKPIVAFTVMGTGEWSIDVLPFKSATLSSAKSGSGSGATVIKFSKASSGFKKISWTHAGERVFSVMPVDAKGKTRFPLLVKIGTYKGTVSLPAGTQYLAITADGNWTYAIK